MSDVIASLKRDLEQRLTDIDRELAAYEPLMRERDQIEAALAQPPFSAERAAESAPARPPSPTASSRAPRGANREAILELVGERPGVSAGEISDVTKISRAVTYNTLAKLVSQGKLEKTELPGGQTGYKAAV